MRGSPVFTNLIRPGLTSTLALVLFAAPSLPVPTQEQTQSPTAIVVIDGLRLRAVKGLELGRGNVIQTPDGVVCQGPDYRIELSAPPTMAGGVTLERTESCMLRVADVSFTRAGATTPRTARVIGEDWGFAALAATEHRIWGRHVLHEQFHITVTLVHQEFTYLEDGSSVYNPSPYSEYCWQDGVGWSVLVCAADTYLSGPTQVERWTFGRFRNNCCGGIEHTLEARPQAWTGGNYVACIFSGSVPFGWHDHCQFDRVY